MQDNDSLMDKLSKILALTESPVEGEAQAAAAMLQKLLTKHNLSIADLERRGQTAPAVREQGHDLGKAAFAWKLDLAEAIAKHYYCHPLVNRRAKTVAFIGRPDNVESLQMLYQWLIDQIRRIASEERRKQATHIDPLRWQLSFGTGAVERIGTRLRDLRAQEVTDVADVTALVIHHDSEISDYTEERYGYRTDGKRTKRDQEWAEAYERRERAKHDLRVKCEKEGDMSEYYAAYPSESPAAQAAREKEMAEWVKRAERNEKRRKGRAPRYLSEKEWDAMDQRAEARRAGRMAGDSVNLQPFLKGGDATPQVSH